MEYFAEGVREVALCSSIIAPAEISDELGRKLCHWFYCSLPKQVHQIHPPLKEFASLYLTENVKLECTNDMEGQGTLQGAGLAMAAWLLCAIFKEEKLSFSPNFQFGGVKSKHDRYGILSVEISGTVHRGDSYIGLFDHTFKAVQVPGTKTYKINSLQLNMRKPGPS